MNFIQQKKIPNITPQFFPCINNKNVQTIPIKKFEWARDKNCNLNAQNYTDNYGGKLQLGWRYSSLGNVLLRIVAHCVIKDDDGKLFCVTPSENDYEKTINFIPDDSIIEYNGRLPSYTIPIINNTLIAEWAKLECLHSEVRMKYSSRQSLSDNTSSVKLTDEDSLKMTFINKRFHELIQKVELLALNSYQPNDLCHCASGLKFKKCCK
ncbi:SEC-C domain-containing protein [Vibrio sp. 1-Bac 57]